MLLKLEFNNHKTITLKLIHDIWRLQRHDPVHKVPRLLVLPNENRLFLIYPLQKQIPLLLFELNRYSLPEQIQEQKFPEFSPLTKKTQKIFLNPS